MARAAEYVVCFTGNRTTGKSSIIAKMLDREASIDVPPTAVGAFALLKANVAGTSVTFRIWDIAGDENYASLMSMYLRNANLIVVVFALDSPSSFNDVTNWINKVRQHAPAQLPILLVGNKLDLVQTIAVSEQQAEDKAKELGAEVYRPTSAKDGSGIDGLVDDMAKQCAKWMTAKEAERKGIDISGESRGAKPSDCC
jgi:small GTP-binding protein